MIIQISLKLVSKGHISYKPVLLYGIYIETTPEGNKDIP